LRCGFNPRTPAGCDSTGQPHCTTLHNVSIHAPLRGATWRDCDVRSDGRFQSTHPCGVRLDVNWLEAETLEFQSTHPCGVRQGVGALSVRAVPVSIHAPLRGATPGLWRIWPFPCVSIHAPLRGATVAILRFKSQLQNVSIHAPLRGATSPLRLLLLQLLPVSIHAPLRGATGHPGGLGYFVDVSIHAPLRGATTCPPGRAPRHTSFNPRTPAGCDKQEVMP